MSEISNLNKEYFLENVNWPDKYPYKPKVSVRCSIEGEMLHLRYEVTEQSVKAEEGISGNEVYKDSCVEFFIKPLSNDPHYYNFEWNAIGTLDLAYRTDRYDSEKAPKAVLDGVIARSSLGNTPFKEIMKETSWTLDIDIPTSALWRSDIKSWKGLEISCNFFKCGDGLTVPHFLSWAPIKTENPDFHRPEFFKPFVLQ